MMRRYVVVLLAALMSIPALAQRTSLADRISSLEQQSATQMQGASQANIEVLNKTTQMQDEIRSLRALVEQLQNELEQGKQRNHDQYVDLESRVNALEQSGATTGTSANAPPAEKSAPTAPTKIATGELAVYQEAHDSLIKQGDANKAINQFQDFLQKYPQSGLAANAWYWLGESYYISRNFDLALKSFSVVSQQYQSSNKFPDALLKIAYSHIELGDEAAAKTELEQLIHDFPEHPVAEMARGRLRGLSLGH